MTENNSESVQNDSISMPESNPTLSPGNAADPPRDPLDSPITVESVLDFTFGVGLTAVEVLNKVVEQINEGAKQAQAHAPTFVGTMQEKGRPAREQLMQRVRTQVFTPAKPSETKPDVPVPTTAEDEIQTLEERVRQLEKQVAPSLNVSGASGTTETNHTVSGDSASPITTAPAEPTADESSVHPISQDEPVVAPRPEGSADGTGEKE